MTSPASQPLSARGPKSAREALENRENFSLWAEAVKQQMLAALQKRQRSS